MNTLIRNFGEDFDEIAIRMSNAPAIIVATDVDFKVISYGMLANYINKTFQVLTNSLGIKKGETIMALMPNAAETVFLFLACLKNGINYAPIPCTATHSEIKTWRRVTQPAICILSRSLQPDKKKLLCELGVKVYEIECDSAFSWLSGVDDVKAMEGGMFGNGSSQDASLFLSTSGTTGAPKALVIKGDTLWSSGVAFSDYMGIKDRPSRFWNYLPMSYLGGLFNLCLIPLASGSSIVIDEPFSGKTILQFWSTVERFDIKSMWFVPPVIRGLLKIAERRTFEELKELGKKIEMAFLGTAPIDLQTKLKFEQVFGIRVFENFALSETTFFTTETSHSIQYREEGSVGNIIPYTNIKLVSIQSAESKNRGLNEIYVKSPFFFKGYIDVAGEITKPLDADGYLPTGDLGRLTENGTLVITGRTRDIIKKGGYFVSLREIEILAESHPAIVEAAATKIAHDFYGETYFLYVIFKGARTKRVAGEFEKYMHTNLISYKWPEQILYRTKFPRTASGKVQKSLLDNGANAA